MDDNILKSFSLRPGATDEGIFLAEEQLQLKLPRQYLQFLRMGNGGEGFIGESYAILWQVSELAPLNESYESNKWAPGLLIFGSDGGGEAFGFDTRDPGFPILQVPFIGMKHGPVVPRSTSFFKNSLPETYCESAA